MSKTKPKAKKKKRRVTKRNSNDDVVSCDSRASVYTTVTNKISTLKLNNEIIDTASKSLSPTLKKQTSFKKEH